MPIIHDSTRGTGNNNHPCKPPSQYGRPADGIYWANKQPKNSVWMCADCEKYFVTRGGKGYEKWYPVKWHHFVARGIIAKYEDKGRETVL